MKVMEVYMQETTALLYLNRIPNSSRHKILSVAQLFPTLLARCHTLKAAKLPKQVWYKLHLEATGEMGSNCVFTCSL